MVKRIIVTGAGGFVGQHLVNALIKKKYDVTGVERKKRGLENNKKTIFLDISKYKPNKTSLVKNANIIFHLAGTVSVPTMLKNPSEHTLNNIVSTLNILEDIRLNNPKCLLVFASSDKSYGNTKKRIVKEEDINFPIDPYGASKLSSELLIHSYHLNYNINYIIIRSGNTFGPMQTKGLFVPSMIKKIIESNGEINIGNLSKYRNFVYVDDVIQAFMNCVKYERARNRIFNISSYNLQMKGVLDQIIRIAYQTLGKKVIIKSDYHLFRKSESKSRRFLMDCKLANNVLHWKPKLTFKNAMKITFDSYLKQKRPDK